jgi:importin-4
VPKLSQIIHTDEERIVVIAALEGISQILEQFGPATFEDEGHKDAIFSCIFDVLHGKVTCQYDEPEGEDEDESEYDVAILESAGEILPKFGKAMSSQEFYDYFGRVSQFFATKIVSMKLN